ncbi:MAG: hypothetical protein QG591_2865 [Planctomycetota bacterium]|jgi:hypothetical protein|nr:hypothetical protein [Planctomycetota bacterium]
MCNQTVGLIAAELERQGIATVAIQLLREVAERVRPPRALFVPFRHGYPLDTPENPKRQHAVLEVAIQLLEEPSSKLPVLVDFQPIKG